MKQEFEQKVEEGEGLLWERVHSIEECLTEEIKYILKRNQNETYLRSLLTRALILEELIK